MWGIVLDNVYGNQLLWPSSPGPFGHPLVGTIQNIVYTPIYKSDLAGIGSGDPIVADGIGYFQASYSPSGGQQIDLTGLIGKNWIYETQVMVDFFDLGGLSVDINIDGRDVRVLLDAVLGNSLTLSSPTASTALSGLAIPLGSWFNLQLSAENGTLAAKVWPVGAAEPACTISIPDIANPQPPRTLTVSFDSAMSSPNLFTIADNIALNVGTNMCGDEVALGLNCCYLAVRELTNTRFQSPKNLKLNVDANKVQMFDIRGFN